MTEYLVLEIEKGVLTHILYFKISNIHYLSSVLPLYTVMCVGGLVWITLLSQHNIYWVWLAPGTSLCIHCLLLKLFSAHTRICWLHCYGTNISVLPYLHLNHLGAKAENLNPKTVSRCIVLWYFDCSLIMVSCLRLCPARNNKTKIWIIYYR